MTREQWAEVLQRITGERPLDLDDAVFGTTGQSRATRSDPSIQRPVTQEGRTPEPPPFAPPSARLLHTRPKGSASIGIRITVPPRDPVGLALHLAAMAVQKGVDPIILSAIGRTGFERWGFRVERLPPDPGARAQAEAELAAFWGIAVIIDAEDVAALG